MSRSRNLFVALFIRMLQLLARVSPGAMTLRVWLNRWRGVRLGKRVWIGYDSIIETSYPDLVEIQDDVTISIRATIIAHFRESRGVIIEKGAFIGPGAIIMPNVKVGEGAVVTAGSVVTSSVAPMTMVQGNPAKPVARVGVALGLETSLKRFLENLRPIVRD